MNRDYADYRKHLQEVARARMEAEAQREKRKAPYHERRRLESRLYASNYWGIYKRLRRILATELVEAGQSADEESIDRRLENRLEAIPGLLEGLLVDDQRLRELRAQILAKAEESSSDA
jgi:hypothetical protein